MDKTKEINRGYLDYAKGVSSVRAEGEGWVPEKPSSLPWRFVAAVSGLLPARLKQRLKPGWVSLLSVLRFIRVRVLRAPLRLIHQIVATALLILTSILLGAVLKVYLWVRRSRTASLNQRALEHVPEFVAQYPFHLYPVVLKSLEFAFLEEWVHRLREQNASFVEMAIGEGTFSARIFPLDARVVGLDLNPYSLRKAVQLPHVQRAVICDCLNPPISSGYFDVILSNNFLHHVTMKEQTLANWSKVSRKLIFNESTPYWASSWAKPFMLKELGFRGAAQRAADKIESKNFQHLESKEAIDEVVLKNYEVVEAASYMSERTFFLCAVYSFIMGCYGPPTPSHLKGLFLSKFMRWLTVPLTTGVARLLIRYDQFQDRSSDAYISYVCESRHTFEPRTEDYLICPRCSGELTETDRCKVCRKQYASIDQMLFLLPEQMEYVERGYDPQAAVLMPKEHL